MIMTATRTQHHTAAVAVVGGENGMERLLKYSFPPSSVYTL